MKNQDKTDGKQVLAAFRKMPFNPRQSQRPALASRGFLSVSPRSPVSAKTAACEYEASLLRSCLPSPPCGPQPACPLVELKHTSRVPPAPRPQRPRPRASWLLWKMSAPSTKGLNLKIVVSGGGR